MFIDRIDFLMTFTMNIKSNYCVIVILLGFQNFISEYAACLLWQAV